MATRDEIFAAIRNADAAGDSEAVRRLGEYLKTMPSGGPDRAAKIAAQQEADKKLYDPTNGMSTFERVAAGAGKAVSDAGLGIQGLVAPVLDAISPRQRSLGDLITGVPKSRAEENARAVAESRQRDAALMDTAGGIAGNIGGNVLMAVGPGAALKGTAMAANALRAAPTTVRALSAAGNALMVPKTIGGAAAVGGAMGLAQPAMDMQERLINAGVGGVAGAALPVAGAVIRAGRAAVEPFFEAGQQRIVGRALARAAGSDAPEVANRLRDAAQPFVGPSQGVQRTTMGELVPGSLPTVGQAAGNPGVAALERAATATNPEVTNEVARRMALQNEARVGLLEGMAGTDGARDFAVASRDVTADQLYGAARANGVNPAALTPQSQANIAAFQARMPEEVLAKARKLAQINGTPMNNASSLDGLHWSKKALDSLISSAKASGDGDLARAYTGLQADLLKGMDSLSPDYAAARGTFAAMSKPINQMDVAGEIAKKSINPLTGNLQPAAYARNLNDATAARATGFPGSTLENTMEPAQMNALQSILLDVQRANAAQTAGRGVGSDTVQKLAYSNMLDQAGIPSFLRELKPAQILGNMSGRAADVAYGRANRELSNQLAEIMLDPQRAAQVMEAAGRSGQPNQLLNLLRSGAMPALLGAPGAVNAQKQ